MRQSRFPEEREDYDRPDADVDHDVGGIEDIVPVRNMLNIDEVDDTAVNNAVENIAEARANDEAETNVLVKLGVFLAHQVDDDAAQYDGARNGDQPAHAMEQAEGRAEIPRMGEIYEGVQGVGLVDLKVSVDQIAACLRGKHGKERCTCEDSQLTGFIEFQY